MNKPLIQLLNSGTVISLCLVLVLLAGCSEPASFPRKHGFHRIDFPVSPSYTTFSNSTCPFSFEFSEEGKVTRDLTDSCWVDIDFPNYGLKWHISYKDIRKTGKTRSFHFEEHRKLIYKHTKKAIEIRPSTFQANAGNVTLHEVYGNVGTPAYYFISDPSETHVCMVSFYFNTALKNDSLAPVIDYMKEEVMHSIQSLEWKE